MGTSSFRKYFDQALGVDLRSLAVFRIAVASVLLFDIFDRWPDVVSLYSDAGVLPAPLLRELRGSSVLLSVHYHVSDSLWALNALFVLAATAALSVLVGYRSQLAMVASWYLLVSPAATRPEYRVRTRRPRTS